MSDEVMRFTVDAVLAFETAAAVVLTEEATVAAALAVEETSPILLTFSALIEL